MSTKRRAAEMREDAEVQHSIAEMMVANTFDHVLSKAEAIAEAESLLHGGDDTYENPFGVLNGVCQLPCQLQACTEEEGHRALLSSPVMLCRCSRCCGSGFFGVLQLLVSLTTTSFLFNVVLLMACTKIRSMTRKNF